MKEPLEFNTQQFVYEGVKYLLDVRIQYKAGNNEGGICLDMSQIYDLEMCVQLGQLFSDGFIIYKDVNGDISKMNNIFDAVCVVTFMSYKQEGGGFDSEKMDKDNTLTHTFIINNVEIVKNDTTAITYCIYLVGTEYQTLLNHVEYSNYDSNEPPSIIQTMKKMLVDYGKKEVDESFDQVTSGVGAHFISNGNDTVQTALNYLLQKQFFYSSKVDGAMKFLVYDFMQNKYGIFQPGQSQSDIYNTLIISMNNSELDEFITSDQIKLASTIGMKKTDMYIPMSKIVSRTYDFSSNSFSKAERPSSSVVNFYGGQSDKNCLVPIQDQDELNIVRDQSEWDNDFNTYQDFLDIFTKHGAIIVNTGGVVRRKLMSIVNIMFDSRMESSISDSTEDVMDNMSRYKQLMGSWYVTKVRYIIKGGEQSFKQNLTLSRTRIVN